MMYENVIDAATMHSLKKMMEVQKEKEKNLKMEIPHNPALTLPPLIPGGKVARLKLCLQFHIYCTFFHSSQNTKIQPKNEK